ncbi:MAG: hypothetical protein Q8Q14_01480 [Gemmatimonadales bacterium]|nr:hypothetical protein [Gemmatimonadales bacterium]
MTIEDLLWAAVEKMVYITREQYLASLAGWSIHPHAVDGEIVGAVLTKGPELHFCTFGRPWRLTRADIRRYLEPILTEHGRVETKTPKDDARQLRFNKILGFVETGADEFFVHLTLRRLPFSKDTPCLL